ncbi:MAG: hypothetical protein HUJ98_01860 [Bacteroidaceae bacterium]|nr:hypothetical protein [Bacteroidaceae bacterium]
MYDETITVDVDRLRDAMREECLGAYFGGGFGAALFDAYDVDRATPEELVQMAVDQGLDLRDYQAYWNKKYLY